MNEESYSVLHYVRDSPRGSEHLHPLGAGALGPEDSPCLGSRGRPNRRSKASECRAHAVHATRFPSPRQQPSTHTHARARARAPTHHTRRTDPLALSSLASLIIAARVTAATVSIVRACPPSPGRREKAGRANNKDEETHRTYTRNTRPRLKRERERERDGKCTASALDPKLFPPPFSVSLWRVALVPSFLLEHPRAAVTRRCVTRVSFSW
jgi:hypothetical protein